MAYCVIDGLAETRSYGPVLDSKQLLKRLEERGVRNVQIARALKIDPSRVTEMKKGERRLLLDEAVKLVEEFELEPSHAVAPIHPAIPRLIARHIVKALKLPIDPADARMQELVADLQAFSRYVSDPQVRESLEAAESFFQAMSLRRVAGEAIGQ